MTIGTAGEIAGVTARIKELAGLLTTGHCSSARDWIHGNVTPVAVAEKRQLCREQVKAEIKAVEARLAQLNKLRPQEFLGLGALFLGGLAFTTIIFCAATRHTGLDAIAPVAAATYGAAHLAAGASNTRWQGRKGLGLEVGE